MVFEQLSDLKPVLLPNNLKSGIPLKSTFLTTVSIVTNAHFHKKKK